MWVIAYQNSYFENKEGEDGIFSLNFHVNGDMNKCHRQMI